MKSLAAAYLFLLVLSALVAAWVWESGLQPIPHVAATARIVTPQEVLAREVARQAETQNEKRARRIAEQEEASRARARAGRDLLPVQPELVETGKDGPLPRIGNDGRKPWKVYARPFDAPAHRPRLAVVVGGLGLDTERTELAIGELPPEVTLAFSPYGRSLQEITEKARTVGHEILVGVPMEPADTFRDPGPHALKTSFSRVENNVELKWALSRFMGYVGIITEMGARFTMVPGALRPVLEELDLRGLMFVDGRTAENSVGPLLAKKIKLPFAFATLRVEEGMDRAAIDRRLKEIEAIARTEGAAVIVVAAGPLAIERITRWAPTLAGKGLALAPVSALVGRQKIR